MPRETSSPTPTPEGDGVLHGWVDESMRVDAEDRGMYIPYAVFCDPTCCEPVRDTLRGLRYKRQERLHWRDEGRPRRSKIAAAIGSIDMTAVVVVGTPLEQTRQERARRICMETLLPTLAEMGVQQVWLEARTQSLNAHDHRHVIAMRGRRLIPTSLRVDPVQPSMEPMLWIPDAVCGAVGAARSGTSEYLDLMQHTVTEIKIALR